MLSEIGAIIATSTAGAKFIKMSADAGKAIKDYVNAPEPDILAMKQAFLELQEALFEAKSSQVAVQNQLLDLQKALQKQDRFTTQAARYELTQTDMGATIYTLKEDDETGDASHDICADCFEDAIKSHLQPIAHNTLGCNRCGGKFLKKDGRSSGIMATPSRRGLGAMDGY